MQKSWHRETASARRDQSAQPGPGVFVGAVTHAPWYRVGVFLLAFLLTLTLARPADAVTTPGRPPSESTADHSSPLRGESSP